VAAVGVSKTAAGCGHAELRGRSVLVTGAYGLLGSWLTGALLENEARVVVLSRDEPPGSALRRMGLEHRCAVVHGDLTAPGLLERTLAEYEVTLVFHLAAQTLVPTAHRAPLSTFESNIRGTWLLLEACRTRGGEDIATIVASSDKAYGPDAQPPYREQLPLAPRHPYEVSKAAADLLARCYWHTWGLPVAVTRFANLYGGGDLNRSRLIPEAVAAALGGRPPVIRSDGSPERDFLYVEDAVRAYLAIAAVLLGGGAAGEAFNAGSGRPHRVLDVVERVCRLAGTGVRPEVRGDGTPAGEIDRQWVDASKLRELTGWRPLVSLEQGLELTLDWHRRHGI
jgi:CDP-glucose 4,6-dehydratase